MPSPVHGSFSALPPAPPAENSSLALPLQTGASSHVEAHELSTWTASHSRRSGNFTSSRRRTSADEPSAAHHLLGDDAVSDNGHDDEQPRSSMGSRARRTKHRGPNGSISPSPRREHGDMNGHVEHRRKNPSLEYPSPSESLMERESFTLDEDPLGHTAGDTSHGFFELPKQDQRNFMLLVVLYFLQGIPMGLASGSVPFLLKPYLSYGQIGVFSLATYPYSLKLLWSPIVDAVWSSKVGRRKSWIMPIQILSGIGMLWLGQNVDHMMVQAGKDGGAGIWGFTGWWFFLVFMCATQDIAVDGWALTLISPANLSYASTAQTVGLTAGSFMSYTVFLALNAPDFANRWFRTQKLDVGVWSLGGYLTFWGWAYIAVTIGLAFLKKEDKTKNEDGIWDVYKVMWGVLNLKNVQTMIIIHLIGKIGFQANDAVTNLKLIEKGFSQEDMALTVLIDFPFEIVLGYYAGKWSAQYSPLRLYCWSFMGRLAAALVAQFVVTIFPSDGVDSWYLLVVIGEHIFSTFTSTVMFVAVSAFHAKVADPHIGGTYMTLLATVSNLGGTFPRFFILKLVDYFTAANCIPPSANIDTSILKGTLVTEAFSCALEADKHRCTDGGGTCNVTRDGYYITNIICVAIGVISFVTFIRPAAIKLQGLPLKAWRIGGGNSRGR